MPHKIGEGAPAVGRCAYVEIDQLVGSIGSIAGPKLDWIAYIGETFEIDSLTVRPSLTSRQGMIRFAGWRDVNSFRDKRRYMAQRDASFVYGFAQGRPAASKL